MSCGGPADSPATSRTSPAPSTRCRPRAPGSPSRTGRDTRLQRGSAAPPWRAAAAPGAASVPTPELHEPRLTLVEARVTSVCPFRVDSPPPPAPPAPPAKAHFDNSRNWEACNDIPQGAEATITARLLHLASEIETVRFYVGYSAFILFGLSRTVVR